MNKTIRNSFEIAASIRAVNEMLPGLKETEVVPYAYRMMAEDIVKGEVNASVWDDMLKISFDDNMIEYPETRGISIDDSDFKIVIEKNPDYPAAYLNREGVTRVPLAYVTRLVLYYVRLKLTKENSEKTENDIATNVTNIDAVDLLRAVNEKAAELIISGDLKKVLEFLRRD